MTPLAAATLACPKHMTHGPCGGVRPDAACEIGDRPCSFVAVPTVRWYGSTPAPHPITPFTSARPFVMADLPGLISGAAEGRGLGHRFLGHVERCGAILHLIDGAEEDVVAGYKTIRAELEAYGHGLGEKPEIIGLNKCDALTPEVIRKKKAALVRAAKRLSPGAKVMTLSGVSGDGVRDVSRALMEHVRVRRAAPLADMVPVEDAV